jgi:hypothetical protein
MTRTSSMDRNTGSKAIPCSDRPSRPCA